jgi:hypothetical protein
MSHDQIKTETSNSQTMIVLNRPSKHNALSPSLLHDLTIAISEAPESVDLVIVSTSDIFCSGLDINHLKSIWGNPYELEHFFEMLHVLYWIIYAHQGSTVAMVRNGAFGGGFGLACCCDIILARKDSRFVLPGNQFGNLARLARPPIMTKFTSVRLEDVSEIELTGESGSVFEICDDSVFIPPYVKIEAFVHSTQFMREKRLLRSSQEDFAKLCKQIKALVLNDLDQEILPNILKD